MFRWQLPELLQPFKETIRQIYSNVTFVTNSVDMLSVDKL